MLLQRNDNDAVSFVLLQSHRGGAIVAQPEVLHSLWWSLSNRPQTRQGMLASHGLECGNLEVKQLAAAQVTKTSVTIRICAFGYHGNPSEETNSTPAPHAESIPNHPVVKVYTGKDAGSTYGVAQIAF